MFQVCEDKEVKVPRITCKEEKYEKEEETEKKNKLE